ncbi:tetratricopeptide repeat protein [Actinomadura nitritigenes]|uniref:tetratricopeptide repeat protein n=1 Tax=Actinomadura nitritigenes TaxID=134602 RepID=UPI003D929941
MVRSPCRWWWCRRSRPRAREDGSRCRRRRTVRQPRAHGDVSVGLASRNNLAGAYQSAGDLDRAIPLLEATLTDYERILGGDHPLTKAVRENVDVVRRQRSGTS